MNIEVIDWLSYDEAHKKTESIGGSGGFFAEGMRWQDYIDELKPEQIPYAEAIRRAVVKNNIRDTGPWHQQQGVPLFNDETVGTFTFRAWGDIMAAIWSTEENKDYSYNSYMALYS